MKNSDSIKKIVDGIYHLVLDNSNDCRSYGKILTDYLHQNKLPLHSILILDGRANDCSMLCNDDFLKSITHFYAIAYILGNKTVEQTKWQHARLISENNIATRYFNTDEDAFNWSTAQLKVLRP
ncbi:MAG: hypothetical protein GQ547_03280 [Methylophaga sp.]|nr:hypothetical protein [Methylophaga sp.]